MAVRVPPPLVKDHMLELLCALDVRIDLNRRMNETHEEMARAIFKEWLVDFGPIRAKMEDRAPYLAEDLGAVPGSVWHNGKPIVWETLPLDGVAQILKGLALQKYPAISDDYLPVIRIAQLRAGRAADADRASLDVPSEYVVEDGDILLSWSGSLMQRVWTAGRGALNQRLFR